MGMTRVFRPLAGCLLALMLLVTAQSMALARGASVAVDEIILCTGNGPVMISVDANGDPTGESHICPEFTLSLILALDPERPGSFRPAWQDMPLDPDPEITFTARALRTARARGPPAGA